MCSLHVYQFEAVLSTVLSKAYLWYILCYCACHMTSSNFLHADSMEKLTEQLGETGNQSATRGYRTTEPARIVGEGGLASALHF